MKKVFSNASDVIHLFAQRTQSEARCSNVFFDNMNQIYSYGHHYLLGEFVTNDNGELAIIINDRGYSVTTAKHISKIIGATRQYKQFFTESTNPVRVLSNLNNLAHKLQNARKKELYLLPAEELYAKYCEFQIWRGKSSDFETVGKIEEIIKVFRGESYSDYLKKQVEIIKRAEAKKQRELKKQFSKELKEFFAYERNRLYVNGNEDYVRISQDGEFIETTQQVRVPIKEAAILYKMIKGGKDIKGHIISGYTVIGMNGVLKIGCHKINIKNMNEVGEKIIM